MKEHKIVSREEWNKTLAAFVEKEKAFTKARDALSRQRRELPWMRVEANYVFEGPKGKKSFGDLFEGRSQLLVQHFMLAPGAKEGCPGCSFEADNISGGLVHFTQRDVAFVAISRAPIDEIEAYRKRMGWHFPWVSSFHNSFNYDFNVSFTQEQLATGDVFYNFRKEPDGNDELPGNSVFYKNSAGEIFRTYSSYARGCEMLLTTYMMLDLLPKGRDEEGFEKHPMEWVRRHDSYEARGVGHSCH
jgi:predicted dithiol-disulfide oxidoreductase (DUF899 family)